MYIGRQGNDDNVYSKAKSNKSYFSKCKINSQIKK